MKRVIILTSICILAAVTIVVGAVQLNRRSGNNMSLYPVNLKTEYCRNPVGIDVIPRFSWNFEISGRNQIQRAYRIIVSSSREKLDGGIADKWDSGKVDSNESINIEYAGEQLNSGEECYWKVQVWNAGGNTTYSDTAFFEMGLLNEEDWKGKWIGAAEDKFTSPIFRKEFNLDREIKKARAYIYGLGWYELRMNGKKVGNHVLAPANTQYDKYNIYNTYDVTEYLNQGGNAVGIWLGSGYDKGYSQWGWRWFDAKGVILQLNIEYTDGSKISVITDEEWKVSRSPIIYNHIYHGEIYDARMEQTNWDKPGFDDFSWETAVIQKQPSGKLVSSILPPIRVIGTIKPVSVSEPKPGVYVFDMGQNIAGWTRMWVKGPKGKEIVLRHSELVDAKGMVDPWTNREAKAADTYILKGDGEEFYEPRFTYHGFRYVEVVGYPGKPDVNSIEACIVRSDIEEAGSFSTSNELINKIQSNFRWGMLNNFMSIPTDCPQRDERTPCLMDSMVVEEAAINNFHMAAYYTKWLKDIVGDSGNPDWGGDQINLAWLMYQYYNDKRVLESNYETLKRYVNLMDYKAKNHIFRDGFGDWCAPNNNTWESFFNDVREVNTALHYRHTFLLSQMAEALGRTEEAMHYAVLAKAIKQAFDTELWDETKKFYGDGSQTTSILPLAFEIVPDEKRQEVADKLVDNVVNIKKNHLDTGIFGTKYIVDVLADTGHTDLAYTILTRDTYPSFGHQISLGATTTWEQWAFKGGMHSHNHAMFSGVGSSFYTRFAGIRPLSPGYDEIGIKPYIPVELQNVDCSIETIKGRVVSNWKKKQDAFQLDVEVPANSRAKVSVPKLGRIEALVKEGNRVLWDRDRYYKGIPGVFSGIDDGEYITFDIGSGSYSFVVSGK